MQDIRRIAFVSQRFLELQGLAPALFGAGLVAGALMIHLDGATTSSTAFQPFLLGNLAWGMGIMYLQRGYRRTFGDVVATGAQKFLSGMPILLVMAGALADMLIQDAGKPAPTVAGIVLASTSAVIVLRDWPWRGHHLAGVAAGLTSVMVTSVVPTTVDRWGGIGPGRVEAYLLAYTILGLGLIATGLMDHRLLAESLRPPESPGVADDERNRAHIPMSVLLAGLTSLVWGGAAWALDARVLVSLLPVFLLLGVGLLQMVVAIRDLRVSARAMARSERPPALFAPVLTVSGDVLAAAFVVAVAAAVDSTIFPQHLPVSLFTGVALSSAWIAARDWDRRKHYLVVGITAALVLLFGRRLDPARAFAVFLSAVSGALAIAWTVEARRVRTRRV